MDTKKIKIDIIRAGERAVKELIDVAKEKIIKPDPEDELAADRLKNAAATKKLAIFDAFEILKRIEEERDKLDGIETKNNLPKDICRAPAGALQISILNSIYFEVKNVIPKGVLKRKNSTHSWGYGYNEKYDIVVISKDGTIGQCINIAGLRIALPKTPNKVYKRSKKEKDQYWEPFEIHRDIKKIPNIFVWHDAPAPFKN